MGKNEILNAQLEFNINDFHIPRWDEFPDIDIYVDQLVTYINKYLNPYIGTDENPVITKTMINNYVKQKVVPAPIKKKYTNVHIAHIFVLCILKQVYSINDISYIIDFVKKPNQISSSYDNFCVEIESAVIAVFNGNNYESSSKLIDENELFKNIILSFANKLYVEKTFLYKNIQDKEKTLE